MNLSNAGLLSSARQDVVQRQLASTANANGVTYDPTSKAKISNHETDKQAEDNATWFFEYRALLNSKLTTLITSLTSAYTTDLDSSMGAQGYTWGGKNAMQGLTGSTAAPIDPGAARTAFAYFSTYGNALVTTPGLWDGTSSTAAAQGTGVTLQAGLNNDTVVGSTTFLSGGKDKFDIDKLKVDLSGVNSASNTFQSTKGAYVTDIAVGVGAKAGNQMELILYKFFAKPENLDILRFSLFQNVFIVGTSSIPTGSQVQGSIKLDWDENAGKINCTQERYAAFFHS